MAISSRLLTDGEHVIVDTRTHVKALLFPLFLLLVVLAAALFLDGLTGSAILGYLIWLVALVVVLWWVVLGCGTLLISDASTNGQVRLHDIPNVEETQRTLTELLAGTDTTSRRNDGT